MDYIHQFAKHNDTIEHYHHHGYQIEQEHHHCKFLSLHLMPFDNDIVLPRLHFVSILYAVPNASYIAGYCAIATVHLPARAPPVSYTS